MYAAFGIVASNWPTEIHFYGAALCVLQVDSREFLRSITFMHSEFIIDIKCYNA
jgi:hypothetical protein